MQTEETKTNGTEDGCSTFGCCDPVEFKKMLEKKCRCLSGQSDAADFSAMKEGMIKKIMEMYCGSRAVWIAYTNCFLPLVFRICIQPYAR